jgi:hypothetical protein
MRKTYAVTLHARAARYFGIVLKNPQGIIMITRAAALIAPECRQA